MKRAIVLCILIATVSLATGVFLGASVFSGDKDNEKIVEEFGYLERLAYEAAVKYCNDNHYEKTKCDSLMVRTATPFNEEYGAGVYFMFSTARKSSSDTLTISVDMLTDEKVWSVEKIDESSSNDSHLP